MKVKYVADNSTGPPRVVGGHFVAGGYGALLMGSGTQQVAAGQARKFLTSLALSAAVAEAQGRRFSVEPGHILSVFSRVKFRPAIMTLFDSTSGKWNPRRTMRIEVGGYDEGTRDGYVRSSPVTLEFGSFYNEGTKSNRPAFRVLGNAIRNFAARNPGVVAGRMATDPRLKPSVVGKTKIKGM